jgi:DNA polymerase III subunit gamma/tau
VDHATVVRLLELLGEAMEGVRAGADARTRLELALVKAARPETDGSTRALLARIERLERGAPAPPAGSGNGNDLKGPPAAAAMDGARQDEAATQAAAAVIDREQDPQPESMHEPEPQAARGPEPPAASKPHPASKPDASPEPHAREPAPEPVPDPLPRDIESIYALWPAVVDLVRSEHALLGAVIGEARPVAVDGEELTLAYPFTAEFYKKKAEDPANRAAVGEALAALAGGRWRLRYELRDTPASEGEQGSPARSEEEWVARFMEEFDAEELTDAQEERGAQAATSNEKGA